jgi:hypothetical protein
MFRNLLFLIEMKLLAATLSIYILLLAVFPAFVNSDPSPKDHCKKSCSNQDRSCEKKSADSKNDDCQKNEDCQKGLCTPFFSCNKIPVIIPASAALAVTTFFIDADYSGFVRLFISESLSSVWHPPKVA